MNKSLENIIEAAKEAAGKGERGEFRDKAEMYAKTHNVSAAEANKAVFLEYLTFAKNEAGSRKVLGVHSGGIKSFEAALREITGSSAGLEMLKKTAKQSALSRPKQFTQTSPQDEQAVERYYAQAHNGKPHLSVVRDSAESVK